MNRHQLSPAEPPSETRLNPSRLIRPRFQLRISRWQQVRFSPVVRQGRDPWLLHFLEKITRIWEAHDAGMRGACTTSSTLAAPTHASRLFPQTGRTTVRFPSNSVRLEGGSERTKGL